MKGHLIDEELSELLESRTYQKDFNKLIRKITSKKDAKISKLITWHWPEEWDGNFKKVTQNIPLSRFKNILKDGKVNQSWILIPNSYFYFKNRWQLEYFFDPSKNYPNDFDPFIRRFLVKPCYPPMSEKRYEKLIKNQLQKEKTNAASTGQLRMIKVNWNELYNRYNGGNVWHDDSPFNLFLEIDVRGPLKAILKKVKEEIKSWREDVAPPIKETRGRPKSTTNILRKIRNILRTNPQLANLPRRQQAKWIYEELIRGGEDHESLEPITIMRWYLPRLNDQK